MAGEYGPQGNPLNKNSQREVTRFSGPQLREINTQASSYLDAHPEADRDTLVSQFSTNTKQAERFQKGLDVLNQMAVFNSDGFDPAQNILTVVVREDTSNPVKIEPVEGKFHHHYETYWIKAPVEKPKAESKVEPKPEAQDIIYPFASGTRNTTQPRNNGFREGKEDRRSRERREERRRISKKYFDTIILDEGRMHGGETMALNMLRVNLGDDGKAILLYKRDLYRKNPDGTDHLIQIDRETGALITDDPTYRYEGIRPDNLRYYEAHAKALEEGKAVDYQPPPLPEAEIASVYHQAVSEGFIQVITTSNGVVEFAYEADSYFGRTYSKADLEQGVLIDALFSHFSKLKRPLRPQFVTHLKTVKAGLEHDFANKSKKLNSQKPMDPSTPS